MAKTLQWKWAIFMFSLGYLPIYRSSKKVQVNKF